MLHWLRATSLLHSGKTRPVRDHDLLVLVGRFRVLPVFLARRALAAVLPPMAAPFLFFVVVIVPVSLRVCAEKLKSEFRYAFEFVVVIFPVFSVFSLSPVLLFLPPAVITMVAVFAAFVVL